MAAHQLHQGALKGPDFLCDSLDMWLPCEMLQPEPGCKPEEVPPSVFLLQHLHPGVHSPFPGHTNLKTRLRTLFSATFLQGHFCSPSSISFALFPHFLCSLILPLSISIFTSHPTLTPAHILPRTPAILSQGDSFSAAESRKKPAFFMSSGVAFICRWPPLPA